MARTKAGRPDQVARLVERAEIVDIAAAIGLQLDARRTDPRRAICPFHDDKDPSLRLYGRGKRTGDRSHYHCYVCGAHGDALKLVQTYEGLSFTEAFARLAKLMGENVELGGRPPPDRRTGSAELSEAIRRASAQEPRFAEFALARGFDAVWLQRAGVAALSLDPIVERARADRLLEETLVNAGVARRQEADGNEQELWRTNLRGFFGGRRIVFEINDIRGMVAGFAARALDEAKPKYLYSYGFARRDTLYRANVVIDRLIAERRAGLKKSVDLYVVEGLFDALRLEALGFNAVAVLGSRITKGQIAALQSIIATAMADDRELHLHLFLDRDEAGRQGAYDGTIDLLGLLGNDAPFALDVIWPSQVAGSKLDPDEALKFLDAPGATVFLNQAAVQPLVFLAAYRVSADPHAINWSSIPRLRLAHAAKRIAKALPAGSWDRIAATMDAMGGDQAGLAQFVELVGVYAQPHAPRSRLGIALDSFRAPSDRFADLLSALTLARSASSRREYPSDDASWDRLAVAASTAFHLHKARLQLADGPSAPLLAREVPKGGGRYRLKRGPVAEDALIQQYVLMEILRDRVECPAFAENIPAIRYREGEPIYCTGQDRDTEAVSFAYQIDMAIVNGDTPPKREGPFRSYFDCWRSFIDFIEVKIKRFYYTDLQVLRLDIAGYYDNIRREAVYDALVGPLAAALDTLKASDGGVLGFAPLLRPDRNEGAEKRAEMTGEFLLTHSFGLNYLDPKTGEPTQEDALKGIPQGPELSAYLANIALFDLDALMRREIDKINEALPDDAYGAAYARYVDDIVLVCRDVETASQLRRKVEAHLAQLGLALNRKNPMPPPMTREQARSWITDNRAGFGFSGPLADLPTTDSMDPLAEAGEIDRRTALGLIYDPELDNPDNADRTIERIARALLAPDLRFNDRASAYRRLWVLAASPTGTPDVESLSRAFLGLIRRVDSALQSLAPAEGRRDIALACIEGLDRALRAVVPVGALSEEVREEIAQRVQLLAIAVVSDIFTPLMQDLMGGAADELLARYDVRTQIGILSQLAAHKCAGNAHNTDIDLRAVQKHLSPIAGRAPLYGGLQWSLRRFDRSVAADRPLVVTRLDAAAAVFSRFHSAIVQLQRLALNGTVDEELQAPRPEELSDPSMLIAAAGRIFYLWSQGVDDVTASVSTEQIDLDAAATLVNLTYRSFAKVAARRPHLLRMIAGQKDATALPSPPGLEAGGILLWCNQGRLLLARPIGSIRAPVGVNWKVFDGATLDGIELWQAELPIGCRLLYAENHTWSPPEIAKLYRDFFPIWAASRHTSEGDVAVPTVFSFFGSMDDGGAIKDRRMVSWTAASATVDGHAFVRVGDALEAKSVFAEGADYWRYGWAIRDLCNRRNLPGEDDEDGGEGNADASLERDSHRREAIVARVLPRISGADSWGPGEHSATSVIPTRIERGLRLLEQFGKGSVAVDAAYLLAAVAEGMFMNERVSYPRVLSVPGSSAALLIRATRRTMRALPETAAHWAEIEQSSTTPYRRTASAWFKAAERIRAQIPAVSEVAIAPLEALSLGAELLGVTADLRALAFELAAGLENSALDRLSTTQLTQDWLRENVGLDLLLFDDSQQHDVSTDTQLGRLASIFCEIVLGRRAGLRGLREDISPAGWAVLVGVLLQIIAVDDADGVGRPSLWPMDMRRLALAQSSLTKVIKVLAVSSSAGGNSESWPWDAFVELQRSWSDGLALVLRDITDAAAIIVTTEETSFNPRTYESLEGREVVRLPDGTSARLADWQIDIAYLRGDKSVATEAREIGGRLHYSYSLARKGDQPLGLHLVSRKLSAVVFGTTPTPQERPSSVTLWGARNTSEPLVEDPSARLNVALGAAGSAEGATLRPLSEDAPPATLGDENLDRLRNIQQSAWRDRASQKHVGRHRVALLQWDLTETYSAPGLRNGKLEGLLSSDGKTANSADVQRGGWFASTAEHRRRSILKSVLAACADFDVDGLVLPEYSLRPETVNWLARQLRQSGSPITIWCGTFRVPGGTQLDYDRLGGRQPFLEYIKPGREPFHEHSAILTCLRVGEAAGGELPVKVAVRRKRYPSAAAAELIRPPVNEPWRPLLLDATSPFEVGTFAIELICSEIFPHASSANFVGIIDENHNLARRYGIPLGNESPFEYLSKDIYEFARWTSYRNIKNIKEDTEGALSRGKYLQRTLLILPAMTTRSADYHIFGQNQYLAAGLVTVFCNAAGSPYACGGSCFIGLDGWRETEVVGASPYGDIAPGIYQVGSKHSHPLGEREAAVVIADLDLIRTTDQKPRPHYQTRPLSLVAHLPLIFETEIGKGNEAGDYPNDQRRRRKRIVAGSSSPQLFDGAAKVILDALSREKDWRTVPDALQPEQTASSSYRTAIKVANEALEAIELFAEECTSISRRQTAFQTGVHNAPSAAPSPALVDWIYVDDRWTSAVAALATETSNPLTADGPRLIIPKARAEPEMKTD